MGVAMEEEGKRSGAEVTGADAGMAKFDSFKRLGIYRRPRCRCNAARQWIREIGDEFHCGAVVDHRTETGVPSPDEGAHRAGAGLTRMPSKSAAASRGSFVKSRGTANKVTSCLPIFT